MLVFGQVDFTGHGIEQTFRIPVQIDKGANCLPTLLRLDATGAGAAIDEAVPCLCPTFRKNRHDPLQKNRP